MSARFSFITYYCEQAVRLFKAQLAAYNQWMNPVLALRTAERNNNYDMRQRELIANGLSRLHGQTVSTQIF